LNQALDAKMWSRACTATAGGARRKHRKTNRRNRNRKASRKNRKASRKNRKASRMYGGGDSGDALSELHNREIDPYELFEELRLQKGQGGEGERQIGQYTYKAGMDGFAATLYAKPINGEYMNIQTWD
jgi:hypothetical protein